LRHEHLIERGERGRNDVAKRKSGGIKKYLVDN